MSTRPRASQDRAREGDDLRDVVVGRSGLVIGVGEQQSDPITHVMNAGRGAVVRFTDGDQKCDVRRCDGEDRIALASSRLQKLKPAQLADEACHAGGRGFKRSAGWLDHLPEGFAQQVT